MISDIMKIEVSEQAQKWFEDELGIPEGKGVRFLGKVYGNSQIHEGFSIGIDVDEPILPIGKAEYNGILYFIEDADDWFFSGYDLQVVFDEKQNEPAYNFIEQK
ncbi:Hypothetical protein Tpal_1859 [Trichococcus palustris]|uniref:Fes cluster biogenesis n=2 Tax=Trichococcus palustris TaxID=140314 RepID=A0A143YQP3_9LACT|nr:Hypothetical protein Tpal_1859 [Trichococcus palustris]SFK92994.1 Uncharacterized protein YneR [Trichococcus palustris]